MKLSNLNPRIEPHAGSANSGYKQLSFDCPLCQKHRIEVPVDDHPKAWQLSAIQPAEEMFREPHWDEMTLRPSVDHKTHYADGMDAEPRFCHSHFFITAGEIQIL